MSEVELHVLRARLRGGLINKARRGELRCRLPVGLVYDSASRVALDPDKQVQESVRLFFQTFGQTGTAHATIKAFRNQGLLFPTGVASGPRADELVRCELPPLGLAVVDRDCRALVVGGTRLEVSAAALFKPQHPRRPPLHARRVVIGDARFAFSPSAFVPDLGRIAIDIAHAEAGDTMFKTPLSWLFALRELRATIELPTGVTLQLTCDRGELRAAGSVVVPIALPVTDPPTTAARRSPGSSPSARTSRRAWSSAGRSPGSSRSCRGRDPPGRRASRRVAATASREPRPAVRWLGAPGAAAFHQCVVFAGVVLPAIHALQTLMVRTMFAFFGCSALAGTGNMMWNSSRMA